MITLPPFLISQSPLRPYSDSDPEDPETLATMYSTHKQEENYVTAMEISAEGILTIQLRDGNLLVYTLDASYKLKLLACSSPNICSKSSTSTSSPLKSEIPEIKIETVSEEVKQEPEERVVKKRKTIEEIGHVPVDEVRNLF